MIAVTSETPRTNGTTGHRGASLRARRVLHDDGAVLAHVVAGVYRSARADHLSCRRSCSFCSISVLIQLCRRDGEGERDHDDRRHREEDRGPLRVGRQHVIEKAQARRALCAGSLAGCDRLGC